MNFSKGLPIYYSEECPVCEEGIVEIRVKRGISEVISTETCFCCNGRGWLYIKKENLK